MASATRSNADWLIVNTLTQSVRHGLCRDWREYPHTHVNIDLDVGVRLRPPIFMCFWRGSRISRHQRPADVGPERDLLRHWPLKRPALVNCRLPPPEGWSLQRPVESSLARLFPSSAAATSARKRHPTPPAFSPQGGIAPFGIDGGVLLTSRGV